MLCVPHSLSQHGPARAQAASDLREIIVNGGVSPDAPRDANTFNLVLEACP